jgi:nitronate monooxygenase
MPSITSSLGVELPVIQAPMAGVQDEALAVAVASAGGLGSMPCALLDPARLAAALQRFATLQVPINLNFFCHEMAPPDPVELARWRAALLPYYRELDIELSELGPGSARRPIDVPTVELLEQFRPRLISFHFGLPAPALLARIKAWGATVMASATTVEEGCWLERHGADIVIAQGIEAGGHRGHFLSNDLTRQTTTRELVSALSRAVKLPLIAAGGIGSRADVEAFLKAGAWGVQAGTAYLLCPEATTTPVYRSALQQPGRLTDITNLFSGRPARGMVNRLMRDLGAISPLPPSFPWASQALAPLRTAAEARGSDDFTPLWSGRNPGAFVGCEAARVTRVLAGLG